LSDQTPTIDRFLWELLRAIEESCLTLATQEKTIAGRMEEFNRFVMAAREAGVTDLPSVFEADRVLRMKTRSATTWDHCVESIQKINAVLAQAQPTQVKPTQAQPTQAKPTKTAPQPPPNTRGVTKVTTHRGGPYRRTVETFVTPKLADTQHWRFFVWVFENVPRDTPVTRRDPSLVEAYYNHALTPELRALYDKRYGDGRPGSSLEGALAYNVDPHAETAQDRARASAFLACMGEHMQRFARHHSWVETRPRDEHKCIPIVIPSDTRYVFHMPDGAPAPNEPKP